MKIIDHDRNPEGVFAGTAVAGLTAIIFSLSESIQTDNESYLSGLSYARQPIEGVKGVLGDGLRETQRRLEKYAEDYGTSNVPGSSALRNSKILDTRLNSFRKVDEDYKLLIDTHKYFGDFEQEQMSIQNDALGTFSVFLIALAGSLVYSNLPIKVRGFFKKKDDFDGK